MNPTTLFAEIFANELASLPLSGVVVCPGSRSTPLAMAISHQPRPQVYVHLDERSAGFFALGLALESGQPAAVITTSGTAAAELHPALLEADRAAVPLILLTADRPPELRDSGANQTADQVKLYGSAVRWYAEMPLPEQNPSERLLRHLRATADRAVAAALGLHGPPGPAHLNFPFRKPLEPEGNESDFLAAAQTKAPHTEIAVAPRIPTTAELEPLAALVRNHRRGLVIAGTKAALSQKTAALLQQFAAAAGYPILADALSGVRFTPHRSNSAEIISAHPLFLAAGLPKAPPPEVVFLFGAASVSNATLAFVENLPPETKVVAVSPHSRWNDPAFRISHWLVASPDAALEGLLGLIPSLPADENWVQAWQEAEDAARRAIADAPLTEGKLLAEIVEALPPEARLFVGNSLPVRHLDEYAPTTEKPLRVFANRGLSGIDGVVSSAAGVAAASGKPTVLVIGDLAMLHDIGGLIAVARFGLKNFQIVVLNNDGGGIFRRLPIAEHEPPFTEMFRTPHGLNFAPAAAMYGLTYQALDDPRQLPGTLRAAISRHSAHLIEVQTDAEAHHEARQRLLARLRRTKSADRA